jgi:hypothetical protein
MLTRGWDTLYYARRFQTIRCLSVFLLLTPLALLTSRSFRVRSFYFFVCNLLERILRALLLSFHHFRFCYFFVPEIDPIFVFRVTAARKITGASPRRSQPDCAPPSVCQVRMLVKVINGLGPFKIVIATDFSVVLSATVSSAA